MAIGAGEGAVKQRLPYKGSLLHFMNISLAMNYAVYIIFSEKLNRFYVGTTDNPDRRIVEHNTGKHKDAFTKNGTPWLLFLVIDELSSNQAYQIEKHIKKMKSKKYIENLKAFPEIITKLKLLYY